MKKKLQRFKKIQKYAGNDLCEILCMLEDQIVGEQLSAVGGALWEKTYREFHEDQDCTEDYNLICERYDWIIKFIELTELYEGEPDIKSDFQYSLNALESAIIEHKKVTADQGVS